jgi:hypothetical protein
LDLPAGADSGRISYYERIVGESGFQLIIVFVFSNRAADHTQFGIARHRQDGAI